MQLTFSQVINKVNIQPYPKQEIPSMWDVYNTLDVINHVPC